MENKTITTTILNQLGGKKFIAMTGAVCFSDGNTLITKFKGSKKANIMYITLNTNDLYDVKICKFKGLELSPVAETTNAYGDMLQSIFTKETGLQTSL